MQAIAVKPVNLLALLLVGLICLPLLAVPTAAVPWVLGGIGLLATGVLLVYFGDLLPLLLIWLALTSVCGVYFWVSDTRGFFNFTIDRIALGGIVFLFLVALLVGRIRFHWPAALGLVLVGLVGWCAVSAQAAGWTLGADTVGGADIAPPYYRFFAGLLFPTMVFFMAVASIRRQTQIRTVLLFFTLFGLYLTFIGYAQWLKADWLVWPQYILNEDLGIHKERVRGPFLNAPDMGLTLLVCLFANLLLAIKAGSWRSIVLVLVSLPMPVLIFLTLTRSIWLAFVVCLFLAIWVWGGGSRGAGSGSRATRWALTLTTVAAMMTFTLVMWNRLSSSEREEGGVAEKAPIYNRIALAKVSIELAGDHPLIGVGLGRFQEAAPRSRAMKEFESQAAMYGRGAVEHNNFLSMLAETGIPGAVVYTVLIFSLLGVSIRLFRMIPPTAVGWLDRRFIGFYWIVWAAFFIDSMFRLTTSSPFPNGMFLLMGGCVVGYYHQLRPHPIQVPSAKCRVPRSKG